MRPHAPAQTSPQMHNQHQNESNPESSQRTKSNPPSPAATEPLSTRLQRAYERIATPTTIGNDWKTDTVKAYLWAQLENKLAEQSIDTIVLIGAGRHTHWLLESGWPHSNITIAGIIDANPTADQIRGIPVIASDDQGRIEALKANTKAIVPSSDAHESHLIEHARGLGGLDGLPLWKVYTDTSTPHLTHDEIARARPIADLRPSTYCPFEPDQIDRSPAHRESLGLDPTRTWINALADGMRWPDWAQGHVNEQDCAFIWDLIESISSKSPAPISMIEIGTASGVSASAIALGFDTLAHKDSTFDTFDIMEYCYFDPAHTTGSAIHELCPHLADRITLHPQTNAHDARDCVEARSVDLVFIDADHRHPSVALDLLALLPSLAPRAWVILHDIELDLIQSNTPDSPGSQSGPNRLYTAWPYSKTRSICRDPRDSNCGAIQLPDDPLSVQTMLLDLIE